MFGTPIQKKASLASVMTATIFAAQGDGTRWHLTKGLINVWRGTGVALIDVMETDASGTVGATIMNMSGSANLVLPIDFGERGWAASGLNTRLVGQISGSETAVHFIFTGYVR